MIITAMVSTGGSHTGQVAHWHCTDYGPVNESVKDPVKSALLYLREGYTIEERKLLSD